MKLTQRERSAINTLRVAAYKSYLLMCSRNSQVPDKSIVNLIDGCTDTEILKQTSDHYDQN